MRSGFTTASASARGTPRGHPLPAAWSCRARASASWGLRFSRLFANTLKRRRPRPGDKWHLDEVFICIRGKMHYLWRAVGQHGHVLDIPLQGRRSAIAAIPLAGCQRS